MKKALKVIAVLLGLVIAFGLFSSLREPKHLYAVSGTFAACPSRPSCVSSLADGEVHGIAPLSFVGDPAQAQERLKKALEKIGGNTLAHEQPGYLHALFVTPTMRYRDDLELLIKPEGRIEMRSISRFGYRDHGVNRARVEALRTAFNTP